MVFIREVMVSSSTSLEMRLWVIGEGCFLSPHIWRWSEQTALMALAQTISSSPSPS